MRINKIKGHEQTIKVKVDKFDYLKIKISLQTYHKQSKNPIHIMGGNNWNPYNQQIIGMHNNREFQWGCNNKKRNNQKEKEARIHTIQRQKNLRG